jgi:hypothetical protein
LLDGAGEVVGAVLGVVLAATALTSALATTSTWSFGNLTLLGRRGRASSVFLLVLFLVIAIGLVFEWCKVIRLLPATTAGTTPPTPVFLPGRYFRVDFVVGEVIIWVSDLD